MLPDVEARCGGEKKGDTIRKGREWLKIALIALEAVVCVWLQVVRYPCVPAVT